MNLIIIDAIIIYTIKRRLTRARSQAAARRASLSQSDLIASDKIDHEKR